MKKILPISIAVLFLFAPAFHQIQKLNPRDKDAPEIPFHTPAHTDGKALPEHIEGTITIGPEDGIILIHTLVTIHENANLTIKPGTTIAVDEYAGVRVFGTLHARGTEKNPIQFISNELNEVNRHWNGILYEKTGTGSIDYAIFHHASPAISCSLPKKVIVGLNTYLFGNLDLYGPC